MHVDDDAERLTKRRVAFVGQANEELELETVTLAVATRLAERRVRHGAVKVYARIEFVAFLKVV